MASDASANTDVIKEWCGHKGRVLETVAEFDVIECDCCRFKHIIPLPSVEELQKIYRHEYYQSEKPLYLQRVEEDQAWWNLVFDERYDLFEKFLAPAHRRILDIGSGPGVFLKRGMDRGWQVLGLEPSSSAAAYSQQQGVNTINDFLSPSLLESLGKFSVVNLAEVLEHVPSPVDVLHMANKLLEPGGILCVVVPNDYNPIQQAATQLQLTRSWWLAPPHHINYFNPDSLKELLCSTGFSVQHSETTFPIDCFLLMGDNYIGNDTLGRQCHARRKEFELNLEKAGLRRLKQSLYQAFLDLGMGREIVMFATKI